LSEGRRVMRRHTTLAILAVLLVVAGLGAQAPAPPARGGSASKGLIVGRVVDAVSNAPIPSVIVTLAGAPLGSSIRVLTDSQGRFLYRNVPKGSFTLRAAIGANIEGGGFMWSGGFGPQIGPYLNGGYGQRRPGGLLQSIDLADDEQVDDVVIKLWKGGSIDGRVFDEAGEPMVDLLVAAPRLSADGRLQNGPTVRTDDRGAYHLGTLVPGDYVVVVTQTHAAMPAATNDSLVSTADKPLSAKLANTGSRTFEGGIAIGGSLISTAAWPTTNALPPIPRNDGLHIYQTTFAPSATSLAMATPVTVSAGEARTGVDVSMTPVRGGAVSGTLADDLGPLPDFGVRLFTHESDPRSVPFDVARTSTDASGRFVFPLVPPGAYRVVAQRYATTRFGPEVVLPPPGPPRAADRVGALAQQTIVVGDQDVTGIALQLGLGVQVSGRVAFRGKRPGPDTMRQLRVFVSPLDPISHSFPPRPHSVIPDAKDAFAMHDVPPGRYFVTITDRPDVSLLGVTVGGRDVTERSFAIEGKDVSDVTVELTDLPAEIAGTARRRTGAPDPDAAVVLFPADRTQWSDVWLGARMFRTARVSRTGTFSLKPVLPGEYFIVALTDDGTADFPDAKFLEALTAVATTVRVEAAAAANITLTSVDAPMLKAPSPAESEVPGDESIASGPRADASGEARALSTGQAARTASAQKPKVTVVLSGIVTTDDTPARPLRHAIVTVSAAEFAGIRQAVTGDDGKFMLADLPPGRYAIVVEKPGYVKTFYGNKRPGGMPATPVAVLAGQAPPDVAIRVPRGGVVAGAVRDQFGTPVSGAQVSVKQVAMVNGSRRMSDVPNLRAPFATTDDQGRYRIYGLPPGEYAVFCSLPPMNVGNVRETNSADVDAVLRELRAGRSAAALPASPPTQVTLSGGYLPGVPDAGSAQLITLGAGEERTGADILIGPLRALNVSGTSVGPGGAQMNNIMLVVVNTGTGARIVAGSGGARDGRFSLSALPPGRYVLVGRAAENNAGETNVMPYFAETEFVLTDQNISVTLQFERGTTIEGRIVPPAGATPDSVESVRLSATPVDGYTAVVPARVVATTRPDGTFTFDGVGPGKWRVTGAALPPNWSLRSAMLGDRDTLDAPLEVRPGQTITELKVAITDRPTVITGTIQDATGQPTSEYSMVAFSTDRALWNVPRRVSSVTRLSSDGRFTITGLPPGEYYLAVSDDLDPAQLGESAFLESLVPAAITVVLTEGERKVQDYRIR
jgi:hypothetical protein